MVLGFETEGVAASTLRATNHSEAKYYSGKGAIYSNNASVSSRLAGEVITAKEKNFVKRNIQHGSESFQEDAGSLFSRLKCKNTSTNRDSSCNVHEGFVNSSKPNKSKEVHKMRTPWLVVEKDRSSLRRYVNSNIKNDGNNKNNGIEVLSSIQDCHVTTSDPITTAQKQTKKSLRSVLFGRRRHASATDTIVSTSEPTKSSNRNDESSSHHLYHVFPGSTSDDITAVEIERIANGDRETESSANHKVNNRQCGETKNDNKSAESQNRNNESSAFINSNDLCYSDDVNSIINIHKDRASTTMMVTSTIPAKNCIASKINSTSNNNMPITSPRTKQMGCMKESSTGHQYHEHCITSDEEKLMKCRETKITTPKRWNSRSPSPSRLREQLECKKSVVPQKEKFESSRYVTADYDRELLIGLEINRDLDRMCGATGSEGHSHLYSGIERKPPREDRMGFSILSSSMSCLNPTLQLDGFETTKRNVHSTNGDDKNNRVRVDESTSSSTRSKSMANNCCSGASSALLLDIKDDDHLWKFYDDMEAMHRSSNTEKKSSEIKTRESRECHNSLIKKGRENYVIDGEHRVPLDDDLFEKFGHPMSNGVTKRRASKDLLIYDSTKNQTRCEEECAPFVKSRRTPMTSKSEDHCAQNLVIDENQTYHRYPISTSRDDSLRKDNARDILLEKEFISMSENDEESRFRYESLMNYPNHSRNDQEKFQPNKKALLDQMRHAVEKASAQLDSHKIMKATDSSSEERYSVMTMETECSDESSYVYDYPRQQKTRLLQMDSGKRTPDYYDNNKSVISPGNKRDKYDFQSNN